MRFRLQNATAAPSQEPRAGLTARLVNVANPGGHPNGEVAQRPDLCASMEPVTAPIHKTTVVWRLCSNYAAPEAVTSVPIQSSL